MVTIPVEGGLTPAMILSSVDFPAPFLPTSPTRSRSPMNRSRFSKSVRCPKWTAMFDMLNIETAKVAFYWSFDTINYDIDRAPSAPDRNHLLGTDDQTRDVIARIIYGFRISTIFGLIVVLFSSIIGIAAGAVMGYFGGWVDLILQRLVEIWDGMPMLYVIIIMAALFNINFPILVFLVILFSWTGLLGVVRAEFLRARNFEYVRAARAMGVSDIKIMFRHLLPNAMVATLTFLPFTITASIGTLTTLDFLGYGLPPSYPSLGELALQAKNNLQAPWLAFSAFITLAVMLSLLVFVFEGIRDAFDPRKTFK